MVGFFSGYSVFFVECHEDLIWIPFSGMCSLCLQMVMIIFCIVNASLLCQNLCWNFFSCFYDLLSIFTYCFLFLLYSNNFPSLLPLFNSIVATICHMIFSWFDRINLSSLCTDYLLMKRKSQKKKESQQHKKILMIIIYFYNFVLKFIYTLCNDSLSKAQPPPFNDTYLHALSYKTFYNIFFSSLIICLFIFYRASMIFITFFLSLSW